MSDYTDFVVTLRDWANRQDWSDALVMSYVRAAEQKLNSELRIARMIKYARNTVADACGPLPDDWLEMDLVQIAAGWASTGFCPIHYKAREEFFRTEAVRDTSATQQTWRFYTLIGRTIYFGGQPDEVNGTPYKIAYYAEVPVFADATPSWVYSKYPSLYLYAALMHAELHAIGEEQSAANMKALAEDAIQKLNQEHQRSKASGSRLTRMRRSFG
jgi:hypothetical protein